jgi:hypothetical protein
MFGGGGTPAAPALPPAPTPPPTLQDPSAATSRQSAINAAQLDASGTILSDPDGIPEALDPANTTKKTVLGQ